MRGSCLKSFPAKQPKRTSKSDAATRANRHRHAALVPTEPKKPPLADVGKDLPAQRIHLLTLQAAAGQDSDKPVEALAIRDDGAGPPSK